jgi:choline dehydrogenase-like flavoprotein
MYDGWCHVGCPIGALANPVVTYLSEARKAGAEVRALCTATRVLSNQEGTRATGVEYYDANRQRQVQEASVVILAAWSAQNPRLLLNSVTDKHPKGLANSNDLVGKFMMVHHIAGTWALFDEDITPHMGTVGAQFMSYDRYIKTSYPGAFGSSFIVTGAAMKTNDYAAARADLFGPELAAFMKRAARGITRFLRREHDSGAIDDKRERANGRALDEGASSQIVHSVCSPDSHDAIGPKNPQNSTPKCWLNQAEISVVKSGPPIRIPSCRPGRLDCF